MGCRLVFRNFIWWGFTFHLVFRYVIWQGSVSYFEAPFSRRRLVFRGVISMSFGILVIGRRRSVLNRRTCTRACSISPCWSGWCSRRTTRERGTERFAGRCSRSGKKSDLIVWSIHGLHERWAKFYPFSKKLSIFWRREQPRFDVFSLVLWTTYFLILVKQHQPKWTFWNEIS